jgi:hypothetical protein
VFGALASDRISGLSTSERLTHADAEMCSFVLLCAEVYVSLLRFHINKCGGVFPVISNTVPPASLERQGSPPGRPPLIPNLDDRRLPTKTSGVGVDFGNLLKAGEIVVAVAVSGVYHRIFVGSGLRGPSRPSVTQRSLENCF